MRERSVRELLAAIRRLRADPPVGDARKWYLTQKQHWIGWLGEYHGPGAYGRKVDVKRNARFAYNHVVEPAMLLYLANASGVDPRLIAAARRASAKGDTLMQKSGAIRSVIPWETVAAALWPRSAQPDTAARLDSSRAPARPVEKLTTTIERQWLREIVAGRKTVEYRAIKPYWTKRLERVGRPFLLRMINGMAVRAPEVTVLIDRVRKNRASGRYALHIAGVVKVKHWDARHERPAR